MVSHCVLNQNSVVAGWARAPGAFAAVAGVIMAAGMGIYQLPCPELRHLGMTRPPQTYAEYDTAEYAAVCRGIAGAALDDLAAFKAGGASVAVVIGVGRSPTCSLAGRPGHLYRVLLPALAEEFPELVAIDVPADFTCQRPGGFPARLEKALTGRDPG